MKPTTPAADGLIAGDSASQVTNYFSDATQQFHAGVWSSTRGKWRIRYTESEFCCLTAGRVVLENPAGQRWEFASGVGFVVPADSTGPGKCWKSAPSSTRSSKLAPN